MAQSIPIEYSEFHAASLNAVDSMQHGKMHPDGCSGFHAVSLNAVDSMQHGKMHPN